MPGDYSMVQTLLVKSWTVARCKPIARGDGKQLSVSDSWGQLPREQSLAMPPTTRSVEVYIALYMAQASFV